MEAVRFSTSEDAAQLAPNLREEDLAELLAAGSPSALAALQAGVRHSKPCLSIVDDQDTPVTMLGVVPSGDPNVGFIWLLSSDVLDKNKIKFLRHSKKWLPFFHARHPVLTNYVDARNDVHIKWLQWMGFVFLRQVPGNGPERLPFYEFVRLQHV
jgi:hypothetical protein